MAEGDDTKIPEAAGQPPEEKSQESNAPINDGESKVETKDPKPVSESSNEEKETTTQNNEDYKWCKCFYDPGQPGVQNFYFLHTVTQESSWQEPNEPYWIWDAAAGAYDASGLQQPSSKAQQESTSGASPAKGIDDPDYQGYNPKIHGSYDPNAPYAQYHKQKHNEQSAAQVAPAAAYADYTAQGTFNRFTGAFQGADRSAERHNDFNKSGRQLNAFFDVDAAANAHDGRSLKEERRSQKLSKKEIAELSKKRREKKEKKRMDFYKS